jgi:hypothetical protein
MYHLATCFNLAATIVENYKLNVIGSLYAVDIQPYLNQFSSGTISIKINTIMKTGGNALATPKWVNTPVGYYWSLKLGKCDGSMVDVIDARDILESFGNYNLLTAQPAAPFGKRLYLTDVNVNQAEFYQYTNPSVPFASVGQFLAYDIFAYELPEPRHKVCLDEIKLNYYLDAMMYRVVPDNVPSGYSFVHILVGRPRETRPIDMGQAYSHSYEIRYGKFITTSDLSFL